MIGTFDGWKYCLNVRNGSDLLGVLCACVSGLARGKVDTNQTEYVVTRCVVFTMLFWPHKVAECFMRGKMKCPSLGSLCRSYFVFLVAIFSPFL